MLRIFLTNNKSYDIKDESWKYVDLYDFIESHPTGITVEGDQFKSRNRPVAIYIDGMPSHIRPSEIIMAEVESIDILRNSFSLAAIGDLDLGGVISIYFTKGEVSNKRHYVKGRYTQYVDGFQVPGSFYSPKYTPENIHSEAPDYRPTLYWNPFVVMEGNEASVEFFTGDFSSEYLVIIEGISRRGKICRGAGKIIVE